ncbi:MAG TPA: methylated-DNA--[protein]-cysteine S-methyltransferase [Ktedonobacterales bacterium]|nr:methylated-DNA--[protein]-cysteine S-methyltransferase [Ktedonobacterales bacterium]
MTRSVLDDRKRVEPTASAQANLIISYALLQTPIGPLHLFSTSRGLVKLALPNEPRSTAEAYIRRLFGPIPIREDEAAHEQALAELAAYFAGAGRSFSTPLDPRGTPFQRLVWGAVAAVPYGETRTYGAIARAIGRPEAPRAVGAANGANPLPIIIPCHRLIGANGNLIKYGGGIDIKRRLLALEQGSA